jgi:hypothetical protein
LGLSFFPALAFAAAARVDFAVGNVTLIAATGQQRPLHKGDAVEVGDTIKTNGGRAQLRFTDGAYVSLQPDTLFRVDQYRFEGRTDGNERGFFSLLQGGMRTITGLVGRSNKRNYQVQTRVATIGIRGTEYQLKLSDGLSGSVGEGEVGVCNAGGCLGVASGQSFFVLDTDTRPSLTAVRTSFAPPQPRALQSPKVEEQTEGTGPGPIQTPRVLVTESEEDADLPSFVDRLPPLPGRKGPPGQDGNNGNGGNGGNGGGNGIVRTQQAMAYARDVRDPTIDLRNKQPGTAIFEDSTFKLLSYSEPGQYDLRQSQTSVVEEVAGDDIMRWGKLTKSFVESGATIGLRDNQAMHYVTGTPAPASVWNGTAAHYVAAAGSGTFPTGSDNGSHGTFDGATLTITFHPARVNLTMDASYGGNHYNVNTARHGEAISFQLGQASFSADGLTTQVNCANGCRENADTAVRGIVFGTQAERAGMAYRITDPTPAASKPQVDINGVAGFQRNTSTVVDGPGPTSR